MAKVIALDYWQNNLAELLRTHGYTILDTFQSQQSGVRVDAYLTTSYRPDMTTSLLSSAETAHTTLGSSIDFTRHPAAIVVDISGMPPEELLNILTQRIRRYPDSSGSSLI